MSTEAFLGPNLDHFSTLALALSLATAAVARATNERKPDAAEARKAIDEAYMEWGRARVAYDVKAFDRLLVPDFYVLLDGNRLSRQEFIDIISERKEGTGLVRFDTRVLSVIPRGDDWEVVITEKLEVEKTLPGGKTEKVYALWITRDGFRVVNGLWKFTYSEAIGRERWDGGLKPPFADWWDGDLT